MNFSAKRDTLDCRIRAKRQQYRIHVESVLERAILRELVNIQSVRIH